MSSDVVVLSGSQEVELRPCCFISRWQELVSLADERKRLLKGAEQVHKFIRDVSETNDRMNEKV